MPKSEGNSNQLERILWLHQDIKLGKRPTMVGFYKRFKTSLSTAYRDLDVLKHEYKAPVVLDRETGGLFYTNLDFELPTVKLTESDVLGIFTLDALRRQYTNTMFYPFLARTFERIVEQLPNEIEVNLESLSSVLTFELSPVPHPDLGVIQLVRKAIKNRETIDIKYFSGQKAIVDDKRIDPYCIVYFKDNWYLVGWCHTKMDWRDFLLTRVLEVKTSGKKYIFNPSFNLEKHKRESMLFFAGEKPIKVVIEFDRFASHWIRMRKLHENQIIEELAGGTIKVILPITSYENVMRFILSFGEHARVLEPRDLIEKIWKSIERMYRVYRHGQFPIANTPYETTKPQRQSTPHHTSPYKQFKP